MRAGSEPPGFDFILGVPAASAEPVEPAQPERTTQEQIGVARIVSTTEVDERKLDIEVHSPSTDENITVRVLRGPIEAATVDLHDGGVHSWDCWQDDLHRSWPVIGGAIGALRIVEMSGHRVRTGSGPGRNRGGLSHPLPQSSRRMTGGRADPWGRSGPSRKRPPTRTPPPADRRGCSLLGLSSPDGSTDGRAA